MKKKAMALVLALGLVTVGIVGGTMAWLTAEATEVKNVFTPSNIDITLSEETKTHDETTDYRFKMVPGDTFAKDPKVKVDEGSEACWLFVAITESSNLDTFITYGVADGWTQLEVTKDGLTTKHENIYWRSVGENDINMRDVICDNLEALGVSLDLVKNKVRGKETIISRDDSKVTVMLIPTNEELMIARDTLALTK